MRTIMLSSLALACSLLAPLPAQAQFWDPRSIGRRASERSQAKLAVCAFSVPPAERAMRRYPKAHFSQFRFFNSSNSRFRALKRQHFCGKMPPTVSVGVDSREFRGSLR